MFNNALSLVLQRGGGFLAQLVLLNLVGAEALGEYVLAVMMINLIATASYTPLYNHLQTVNRVTSKLNSNMLVILSFYFLLSIGLTQILLGILFETEAPVAWGVAISLSSVLCLEGFLSGYFVKFEKTKTLARLNAIRTSVLLFVLAIQILLESYDLSDYLLVYTFVVLGLIIYGFHALDQRVGPSIKFRFISISFVRTSALYFSFYCSMSTMWIIVNGMKDVASVAMAGIFALIFSLANFSNSVFQHAGVTLIKHLRLADRSHEADLHFLNTVFPWFFYVLVSVIFACFTLIGLGAEKYIGLTSMIMMACSVTALKQSIGREVVSKRSYSVAMLDGASALTVVVLFLFSNIAQTPLQVLDILLLSNLVSGVLVLGAMNLTRKPTKRARAFILYGVISACLYSSLRILLGDFD